MQNDPVAFGRPGTNSEEVEAAMVRRKLAPMVESLKACGLWGAQQERVQIQAVLPSRR